MSLTRQDLMTCVEIGKAVTATLHMDQLLEIILERISHLIRAKNWTLFLVDPETQALHFKVVVGLKERALDDVRITLGEGIVGAAALSGEPILVPDVRNDPRFSQKVDELTGFVTRSIICLPLKIQNSVIGVIEVVNPEDSTLFDESHLPVLFILADFVAIAIANARIHKEIEVLSVTDDVTGFYNTRFLHRKLDELIREGRKTSLVFLDLDNFKSVVDTNGHLMASQTLGEVATAISSRMDEQDSLVRYGGDEFVVILPDQGKRSAHRKVEQIRETIAATPFLTSEKLNVRVTASFGIANFPEDAASKRELLHLADESMYRSKEGGKNVVTVV